MEIETLGQAWRAGITVSMRRAWGKRDGMKSIRECASSAALDMQTLVCTRGKDFPAICWLTGCAVQNAGHGGSG